PQLATSPRASGLSSLRLWFCDLPPEVCTIVAGANFRPSLEALDLSSNNIGDEGARRLASVAWPELRSLTLSFHDISDAGVRHLLPLVPQLSDLCLSGGSVTDAGALELAAAVDPAKIEHLWLSYNPLSPDCAEKLRTKFGARFHFRTRDDDRRSDGFA